MHDEKTIERFIELRSQGWLTSPVREIPDDEYHDQVQDWQRCPR